jgi:hypothetical protein
VHLLGYQTYRHTPALLRALGLPPDSVLPDDPAPLFLRRDAADWEHVFDEEGVWCVAARRISGECR